MSKAISEKSESRKHDDKAFMAVGLMFGIFAVRLVILIAVSIID